MKTWCGKITPHLGSSFGSQITARGPRSGSTASYREWQEYLINLHPHLQLGVLPGWYHILAASSFTWPCLLRQGGTEERHSVPPWANLCYLILLFLPEGCWYVPAGMPGMFGRVPESRNSRYQDAGSWRVCSPFRLVLIDAQEWPRLCAWIRWRGGTEPHICPGVRKTSHLLDRIIHEYLAQCRVLNTFSAHDTIY